MKEVLIVLIVVLLCIEKFSYAQSTVFNKTHDSNNFNDGASDIIETNDGNFLFVGASFLGADNRNLIVKLNAQGDTLWSKRYTLSIGGDNAYGVIELSSGEFVLCGTLHDTTTVTAGVYLMKIDEQGDSLWVKQYGGVDAEWTTSIVQSLDGGIIVAGNKWLAPNFTKSDAWVFKTDSLGNLLWQKQFDGHGLDDLFEKVIITPDGNIVCAGVTVIDAVTGLDYVVKLNQQGDTIWTREFGGTGGGGIFDINPTQDGGLIGCGAKEGVSGSQRASVYKLDSLGNVLWYNTFARGNGVGEYYNFSAVHELPNGNFMAAGADYDYTQPIPGGSTRIRMMEFNALGDSIWSKQFPHSTGEDEDYLFDMKLTSDGGFIMCGYVIHAQPTKNDALVIKIDSNRCDNIPCQLTIDVEENSQLKGLELFKLYPNPSNGVFTIQPIIEEDKEYSVEIYNTQGQCVLTQQLRAKQIVVQDFSNGIYLIRVLDNNRVAVFTSRIILQR